MPDLDGWNRCRRSRTPVSPTHTVRRSSPVPRAARTARSLSWFRSGPSRGRGARRRRRGRRVHRHARTHARPASSAPAPVAAWGGIGNDTGYWSSRRHRSRTRPRRMAYRRTPGHTGPTPRRPWRRSPGHAERSTTDGTTVGSRHRSRTRHTVDAEIDSTVSRTINSRASSLQLHRDNGTPDVAGSSQASSFISATTRGGKRSGSTRTMTIRQPLDAFFEEPLPPLRHRVHVHAHQLGDLDVLEPVSGREHDPGTLHITLRRGQLPDHRFEPLTILGAQHDHVRAVPGHHASHQRHVHPARCPSATPKLHPCSSDADH